MNNWDRIVRQHGPGVYATAWRILGDEAETESVVLEVFRQADEIVRAGGDSRREALLRRFVADAALERLRQRRSLGAPESDAAGRLRRALARLPHPEAAVFALRYFDDLSTHQIAESLLLSRSAVTACLALARRGLEALLSQEAPGSCRSTEAVSRTGLVAWVVEATSVAPPRDGPP